VSRIVIASRDDAPLGTFPSSPSVRFAVGIESRAVIVGDDRPIQFWVHEARPGAEISWDHPADDHLLFVQSGEVRDGDKIVGADEVYIVEHGARSTLRAGERGAELAHFFRIDGAPPRSGGHVHALDRAKIRVGSDPTIPGITITLFADATCPTCQVWLHGTIFTTPGFKAWPHSHTEDEVIYIVGGEMRLGTTLLKPGTAVAIDTDTVYSFEAGPEGLHFINYRVGEPIHVPVGTDRAPINERVHMNQVIFSRS